MQEKQETVKLRNHFTYIFEQTWKVLILFVCLFIGGIDEDSVKEGLELIRQGNIVQGLLAMGGMLFLMLLVLLWYVNRWYRTTMIIQDGTITQRKATLNQRVNTMSVANISNVNVEQNVFEMLVGTCRLKLDTNSRSTADTTDLEIVLKKKDAERVKQLITSMLEETGRDLDLRKSQETRGEWEEIVYSNRQIIKNGLVTMSVAECISAVALLVSLVISTTNVFGQERDVLVILSTLLLQLVMACSIIGDVLRKWFQDFRFCVRRDQDKIYVSCGLLKKKNYVVPVDKINAVTLQYTFIGRLCKRAYVKVINIGGQGEEANGMKLLLADSYEEQERKLSILLPEYQLPETEGMIKPPKRLIGLMGVYAFIAGAAACLGVECGMFVMAEGNFDVTDTMVGFLIGVGVAGLVFCIRYLQYRTSGILYGDSSFIISRGIFAKVVQSVPYGRIQYIHLDQGPVQRRLGVMQGRIAILASVLSQDQQIGVFECSHFTVLENKLRQTY